MKKILIPTKLDATAAGTLTANGHYEVIQNAAADLKQICADHPDAYGLIVRSEKITAEIMDSLPSLKVIVRAGAGYNTIDIEHARRKGVDVMNTPGANSNAVAEQTVAMMLADARHIVRGDVTAREGLWEKAQLMGTELTGKTVGIVGLGNIGRLVARRLQGFDVNLIGYDPFIRIDRAREFGVEWEDLPALFEHADYISLHLPETDDTRGLVGAQLLQHVKPGATIVNCARAGIVDEDALRAVKQEKRLRYLTDVYPKDAPGVKPVADIADLMLPHLGASTREANANAARRAAEQIIDRDYKGITSFIVNRDIPEGLDRVYCQLANTLAGMGRDMAGRNCPLRLIETSFYGELEAYADWLLVPVVAGIWDHFQPSMDFRAAREFLEERGIDYVNRDVDNQTKGYGESITIDLTSETGPNEFRRTSIRGTVTEGNLMVARINTFDKLYFEPSGDVIMFLYNDRPGVIGSVGAKLAAADINIEDMRNPHDSRTGRSLIIMKVNTTVPEAVMNEISSEIEAIAAHALQL